ncbi:hypothetical protein GIB67_008704 [Kingdonia uniflora]|uniref:Uncharacterized protein n=1 Tax=Kingdonia uniflora TaxID=39325 RepID=A0A7J7NGG5_9MAGN|nr:hypothetical protein GIB67_008704 [Kingdonia uniflora]
MEVKQEVCEGGGVAESSTSSVSTSIEMDLSKGFSSMKMYLDGITFVPEKGFYQPSTEKTWESYQALLSIMAEYSKESPPIVVCSLANEVLSVLKSPNVANIIDKKAEIQKLLCPMVPISYHLFGQFVLIGNNMTDYVFDDDHQPSNVNDPIDEIFPPEKEFYQPKTEHTLVMYKMLLNIVDNQLGYQPYYVGCFIANEVLSILKNKNIISIDVRKDSLNQLLNPISDETFDMLLYIEGGITDYEKCLEEDPSTISKKRSSWEVTDNFMISKTKRQKSDLASDFDEKLTISDNQNNNVEFIFEYEDEAEGEVEATDDHDTKEEEKGALASDFNEKFTLSDLDDNLVLKLVDYEDEDDAATDDDDKNKGEKGGLASDFKEKLMLSDMEDNFELHLVEYEDEDEDEVKATYGHDKKKNDTDEDEEWVIV